MSDESRAERAAVAVIVGLVGGGLVFGASHWVASATESGVGVSLLVAGIAAALAAAAGWRKGEKVLEWLSDAFPGSPR